MHSRYRSKKYLMDPTEKRHSLPDHKAHESNPEAAHGSSLETFLPFSMVSFFLIWLPTGFFAIYLVSFLDLSGYVWIALQHAPHQGSMIIYTM